MFIAMNRFRVKKGSEEAFEKVLLSRDSQLAKVPGFVEFRLLKGPEHKDYTLYASHSIWQSRATFEAWTRSAEFHETPALGRACRRESERPKLQGHGSTLSARHPACSVRGWDYRWSNNEEPRPPISFLLLGGDRGPSVGWLRGDVGGAIQLNGALMRKRHT